MQNSFLTKYQKPPRFRIVDRTQAGVSHAIQQGKAHGRPSTTKKYKMKVISLFNYGISKSEIARKLSISRTSVRKILNKEE